MPRNGTRVLLASTPILKKSEPTPTVPVTVKPTPKNADDIICIEDKTIWSRQAKQQREDTLFPHHGYKLHPPPSTRQQRRNNGVSPITCRRPRRHQRIHPAWQPRGLHPVNVPRYGAYINANSKKDVEKVKQNVDQCIINRGPPPPFKVQLANAELEQPLATYTMRFKIGDYTFWGNIHYNERDVVPHHRIGIPTKARRDT